MNRLSQLYRGLNQLVSDLKTLTIFGGAWGDEGKGKITDALSACFDIVARYSGGRNAGHTVFTEDGTKLVCSQVPCGIAQGKVCVLGRGVLFDLAGFIDELARLRPLLRQQPPMIFIDERCPLWTPYHTLLEAYMESQLGEQRINTTGKGIGPLAGLHRLRTGALVGHLFEGDDHFTNRIERLFRTLEPLFIAMTERGLLDPGKVPVPSQVAAELLGLSGAIEPLVADTSFYLSEAIKSGARLLAEGAQATGLCINAGTWPDVSASISIAGGAAPGLCLPPQLFGTNMMVTKVLPTRVGGGVHPSEIWERSPAQQFPREHSELFEAGTARETFLAETLSLINAGQADAARLSQYHQVSGDERGAVTKRGRSVGYPDLQWLSYAARVSGPRWLALTRFDMLSGLNSVRTVVGYEVDGRRLKPGEMPAPWKMWKIQPIFEEFPGWGTIDGCECIEGLPAEARNFLRQVQEATSTEIALVGVGARRQDILMSRTA